jgi:rRNA maturation endonuclease Nob1
MEIKLDGKKILEEAMANVELEIGMTLKEAVEKQIPKEPLPYKGWEGKCPTCGVIFVDRLTNYCGNCGQKLLWKRGD